MASAIAVLALLGVVLVAGWMVVVHRRMSALSRSLTSRKWDIVGLRAEVGALRRQLGESGPAGPADGPDVAADPDTRAEPGGRPRPTAGATAWRRARAAPARPRRRRPF